MKSESGITIIEVVIAMSVMIVGLISIMGVMANSMRTSEVLSNADTAEAATMAKLEEVKVYGTGDFYGVVGAFDGKTYTDDGVGADGDFRMLRGLEDELCTVTVDDTNPDLLDVTVTTTWTDIQGDQSYELQTMIVRSD